MKKKDLLQEREQELGAFVSRSIVVNNENYLKLVLECIEIENRCEFIWVNHNNGHNDNNDNNNPIEVGLN